MTKAQAMFSVFMTVFLTVYGQVIIKWQINTLGKIPASFDDKLLFLSRILMNPWILSGLSAAFAASLCWMLAMTRLELNYAYPFVSLSFVLIVIAGSVFFNESITTWKIMGTVLIIAGVIVASRG